MSPRHRSSGLAWASRLFVIGALLIFLVAPAIGPASAENPITPETTQEVQTPSPETAEPAPTTEPVTVTAEPEVSATSELTEIPTETSSAEPTATPTEPPPISTTAQPTVVPVTTTATETPAPIPTSTTVVPTVAPVPNVVAVDPAATTGKLVIKVIDEHGSPLGGSCFQVHTYPAGMWRAAACDDNNDGMYSAIILAPDDYVLIQGEAASGYGMAKDKTFTIAAGKTRTITVANLPLAKLVVSVVDATTNLPLAGACFRLTPQLDWPYNESIFSCDDSDGSNDGTVAFSGLIAVKYLLIEGSSNGLAGYIHPADRLVNISTLNTTFNLTVPFQFGASLEIVSEDESGNPLTGACFRLYTDAGGGTLGEWVASDCAYGATPDRVTFTTLPTGDYVIYQLYPPTNYIRAGDHLVHLTAGQASSVTIVNTIGGTILVHTFDQNGARVSWMCYQLFTDDNGSPGELIETQCGNNEHPQEAIFTSLPTGSYILVESSPPYGLLKVENQTIAVTAGVTTTIDVPHTIGAQVLLHLVDEDAIPLMGACFNVEGIQGTVLYISFCDSLTGHPDGDTLVTGLAPGTYSFSEYYVPEHHSTTANFTVTITQPDEIKELDVVNVSFGELEINVFDPNDDPLTLMCFQAYADLGGGIRGDEMARGCDDWPAHGDGIVTLWLPPGNYVIGQGWTRDGYTPMDDVLISVTSKTKTVLNVTVPTASVAEVHTVDIVTAKALKGACYQLFAADVGGNPTGDPLGERCDWSDSPNDGVTIFGGLHHGDYVIVQTTRPTGYPETPPLAFAIGLMETKVVTFANKGYPPKITTGPWLTSVTTTSVVIIWESDQLTVGSVEYGRTDNLGHDAPATPGAPVIRNSVKLTGLTPGKNYYFQVTSSNANGEVTEGLYTFSTNSDSATAKVVIKKINTTGEVLPGACFRVYADAGAGTIGNYAGGACDKWDAAPNNGIMEIPGLRAGNYVLVEQIAPEGYLVASNRTFTIAAGQTLKITVKDTAGGAKLKITKTDELGTLVPDACFRVYQRLSGDTVGALVAWNCDNYDGLDGKTSIPGVAPGNYFLWESYFPDGYIRGEMISFTIRSGQTSRSITVVNHRQVAPDVIELRAVDAQGNRIAGACFALWETPGSGVFGRYLGSACDDSDGINDGQTHFIDYGAIRVIAIEYIAPPRYQAGAQTSFSKQDGKMRVVNVLQTPGNLSVTVTTKKGSSSTNLNGACYALETLVKGTWRFVTLGCDNWDTLDGITKLTGVPPGTYRLVQYTTPAGYDPVDPITVTVTTRSVSVTIRNQPS